MTKNKLVQNAQETIEIVEEGLSVYEFHQRNEKIIGMDKNEFYTWVSNNNFGTQFEAGKGFVPTSYAIKNGYMSNERKVVIYLDDLRMIASSYGKFTPKGQKHILEYFRNIATGVNNNER